MIEKIHLFTPTVSECVRHGFPKAINTIKFDSTLICFRADTRTILSTVLLLSICPRSTAHVRANPEFGAIKMWQGQALWPRWLSPSEFHCWASSPLCIITLFTFGGQISANHWLACHSHARCFVGQFDTLHRILPNASDSCLALTNKGEMARETS